MLRVGAALWTLGDSLGAAKSKSRTQPAGVPGQRKSPP